MEVASPDTAIEAAPVRASSGARRPVVGIVGGGQLARMTCPAAIALDVDLHVLAASATDSAALVTPHVTVGDPADPAALARLAAGCDVVTFDHELIEPSALRDLAANGHVLRPEPATKLLAQDKGHQRATLTAAGLPVPAHARVAGPEDVRAFADDHGWPVVLKATRGGYDGRGVWFAGDSTEAAAVFADLPDGIELLAEAHVDLAAELAVLVARRPSGDHVVYPIVETIQREGICRELLIPARVEPAIEARARELGAAIAELAGSAGILAIELFVSRDGTLLVNELAARPHNSGHFSIEGARTSQFENHLRAVLDWPLGDPAPTAPAVATANVLGAPDGGDPRGALEEALAVPGAHVHLYGKGPRAGRKLGHVTVLGDALDDVRERAGRAAALLSTGGVR